MLSQGNSLSSTGTLLTVLVGVLGASFVYVSPPVANSETVLIDPAPRPLNLPHLLPSSFKIPGAFPRKTHRLVRCLPRLPWKSSSRILPLPRTLRPYLSLWTKLSIHQLEHRPENNLRPQIQRPKVTILLRLSSNERHVQHSFLN
jgi:hypothetical protein